MNIKYNIFVAEGGNIEFEAKIFQSPYLPLFTVDNTGSLPEIKAFFGDECVFNEILKNLFKLTN